MSKIDEKSRASSTANVQISLTEDEKKFFSEDNNFIEYFIEIGVTPNIFSNNNIIPESNFNEINSKLKPEIISKFPYFDKQSMSIDSSIIDFIFPKGYKAVLSANYPKPELYSLILDNQFYSSVYSYKYITCLVFYESLITYKKIYDSYSNNQKSNIDNFNNIFIPKCLCLASVHPSINKFELILKAIYENFEMRKNYFLDLIIEKLISQTPKIPHGLKKIYLKFNETIIDLTENKINELSSVNVNLKELFSLFNIDKIVDIFRYLLYEIKIIFFSNSLSQITNIIMSFLILLQPFTYQYRILSVLPKDYYFFLEDDNPCIFGVNELYYNNFFEDNKLSLDNKPLCIVDIDKKDYYLKLGGGNLASKAFPSIPKHLKEKLDKRVEEFKKSKKKEETNEGYQEIFFRFMINLLKDYPKFKKKTFNGDSNKVQDMIDKQEYINSQNSGDKEFYEKIIYSQMFDEFITKRMKPRDTKEKIQALFFEEKLNIKHAQKKLIRGNKILEQNVLLPSKDYDYQEPRLIIDLTETNTSYSILDINTIKFFYHENINNEVCLPRGFAITSGDTQNELYFYYYLFPPLLSDKLFKYNCKHYITPQNFNLKISKINEDIIHNCFIAFDDEKKSKSGELLNDLYNSYIILFSLSLWYTDKEERETRFNNMLNILNKIEIFDMEVTELLFNALINLGEEKLASFLYNKFNQMHINLTWKIFLIMSKILHKNQNKYSESLKESKSIRSSMHYIRNSMSYTIKNNDFKNFRTRTIKIPEIDDNILGEEILFDTLGACLDCKSEINLEKICKDLSVRDLDKINRFKCKCNNSSLQKLNFKIGTELYNQTITKNSSCTKESIVLYSPTTLKKKLLYISNLYYNSKFDIEKFRINYPEEFWNSVWYFELKGIDISFMLPYIKPAKIKILSGGNKMNNYISFITQDMTNNNDSEIILKNGFKNPNNKTEKIKKKKIVFNKEILYIQHVYQMSIIKIIGMITYKSPDPYNNNIYFNEKVLMVNDNKKIDNFEEKKEKSQKNKIYSNNIVISDLDLTAATCTIFIDNNENNEEYNKLMDGNFNIYENENNNKIKNGKQSKVHFSNEEMFENIREDDVYYNAFKDYREDDDSDDDYDYEFSKK